MTFVEIITATFLSALGGGFVTSMILDYVGNKRNKKEKRILVYEEFAKVCSKIKFLYQGRYEYMIDSYYYRKLAVISKESNQVVMAEYCWSQHHKFDNLWRERTNDLVEQNAELDKLIASYEVRFKTSKQFGSIAKRISSTDPEPEYHGFNHINSKSELEPQKNNDKKDLVKKLLENISNDFSELLEEVKSNV